MRAICLLARYAFIPHEKGFVTAVARRRRIKERKIIWQNKEREQSDPLDDNYARAIHSTQHKETFKQ